MEIKDIVAYLSVLQNPNDTIRLRRIINQPKRKIGESTIDAVFALAEHENRSPLEIMENAASYTALLEERRETDRFCPDDKDAEGGGRHDTGL